MNQTRNGLTAPHSQPVKNTFKQDRHFTTNQQKKTVCRSRCGIIRTKAKTLVIETTLRLAVYSPTVSGVSLCPNSGAGRGVSMAQREGCGLGAMVRKAIDVTNLTVSTPSPPDAYETVSVKYAEVRIMSKPTNTKLLAALRDDDGATNDQLYRLAQIVRLAAFATKAQRCLEVYSDAVKLYPDCAKHLNQCSNAVSNWTCHEVNIGDILTDVAHQIEQIGERLDMRLVRGPLATGGSEVAQ